MSLTAWRLAALWVLAAPLTGCATVWSRGVVQDSAGASVPGASVRVVESSGSRLVAATLTDANGCFMIGPLAAGDARQLALELDASGLRPARWEFELQTPILFATLVPSTSGQESEIRPATPLERTATWQPRCALPPQPGASSLSP